MTENKKARSQYFACTSANLLLVGLGCGIGWLSTALPLLQSDESPLETGPITVEKVSWIGSIIAFGALVGNLSFGYIVTFIGSRHSIFLIGVPQLISWLFMMFGTCPVHLGISRFFTGLVAGGAQVCMSLFTAEIADNNIRGQLSTIYHHTRNFGILFAFTLGSYYNYVVSSMIFTGITISFFVSFLLIPATPQYLLQKNKTEAAEKAYKFYNKHRLETHARDCSIQFESLKTLAKEVREEPKLTLDDIFQVRYAMFQAVMFGLLQCLSAHFTFLTYGSKIIEQSGTHLSSEVSSISMALVQMFATFVTFVLIDRKGRKFLLIISLVGCALGHGAMIAYLYLHNNGFDTSMFHWTPIICMSSIIFAASIGIIPLTFICMAEMFPPKTRSFGLTFGTAVLNIILFLITKAFPILMEAIGLQGCLMIFCVSCTFGTLFAILFVEETKGKDLNMMNEAKLSRNESFVAE